MNMCYPHAQFVETWKALEGWPHVIFCSEILAGAPVEKVCRITSYNVCYTKLLRMASWVLYLLGCFI